MAVDLAALSLRIETTGAAQADAALGQIDKLGARTAVTLGSTGNAVRGLGGQLTTTAGAAMGAHAGFGKVERAVTGMALATAGADGPLGRLSAALLQFGTGGYIVAGVAVAVGTLAYAWKQATKATTDMLAVQDKLLANTKSLQPKLGDLQIAENTLGHARHQLAIQTAALHTLEATRTAGLVTAYHVTRDLAGAVALVSQGRVYDAKRLFDQAMAEASLGTNIANTRKAIAELTQAIPGYVSALYTAQHANDEADHSFERWLATLTEAQFATQRLDRVWTNFAAAMKKVGLSASEMNDELTKALDNLNLHIPTLDDIFGKGFEAMQENVTRQSEIVRNGIVSTISDTIGGAFEDGFKGAAAGMLRGFGGMMVQMGEQEIVFGLGLTAFGEALRSLNGPAAIAAGVALVAAGKALGALAGKLGGQMSGATESVTSPSGFTASSSAAPPSDAQRTTVYPVSGGHGTAAPRTAFSPTFVVIGTDDPRAQRNIIELINAGLRRGIRLEVA